MLASSLLLLPCLVLIRLIPLLPPETVLCTLGLSHLDLGQPVPQCSPCFNSTSVGAGSPCVMAASMDVFSNYMFPPLLILGILCLYEEIVILFKSCKSWPRFYRWAGIKLFLDE